MGYTDGAESAADGRTLTRNEKLELCGMQIVRGLIRLRGTQSQSQGVITAAQIGTANLTTDTYK